MGTSAASRARRSPRRTCSMPAPSLCSWTRPCWARRRPKHSRTTWRAASRDRPAHGPRQRIRILFEPRSETAGHSRRRCAGVMQKGYFGARRGRDRSARCVFQRPIKSCLRHRACTTSAQSERRRLEPLHPHRRRQIDPSPLSRKIAAICAFPSFTASLVTASSSHG